MTNAITYPHVEKIEGMAARAGVVAASLMPFDNSWPFDITNRRAPMLVPPYLDVHVDKAIHVRRHRSTL